MRHVSRILALACAAAALAATPAAADEPCWEYTPGPVLVGGPVGPAQLVVRGPGSFSITPTDCP